MVPDLPPRPPPERVPPPPPPERAKSGWFDYVLIAGTGLLFLLYLPLFRVAPRLAMIAAEDLSGVDLLWLLPLLLMCVCLAAFCVWVRRGPTDAMRIVWTLVLPLAVLGYPLAVMVAGFSIGSPTRTRSTQLPPHSPPVPVNPFRR